MRVALLPASGDPFLTRYWLRHYEQVWADEVDELRVMVCGQHDPEIIDYMVRLVGSVPHATIGFLPRTQHGVVVRYMADQVDPSHLLMLCEDDAFVRHPGIVDSRFQAIEAGFVDVVGTARGNATPNLIARAAELFGPPPETASGETGLSLYPCFLFIKRSNFPDGRIDGQTWEAGDYLPELDYSCTETESCDTFTRGTWALRMAGLHISSEAAYRSDSAHRGPGRHSVDGGENRGDAPWFHVGSLSSGFGVSFMHDEPEQYGRVVANVRQPGELYDWHKRMSWWTRVADASSGQIPAYHARYTASLQRFMADVGADPFEVARWRRNYDPLVTWQE